MSKNTPTTKEFPYTATVTELPGAMIELQGELPWESFATYEDKAFASLSTHVELPGFRKGHVPADVAKKHIGDDILLGDMAERTLQDLYPRIIKDKNIDVIGRPEVSITKIARGNALGFTIRSAMLPEITLPNYKNIAATIPVSPMDPVTEEDVDKVIEDLRQIRAYGHVHNKGEEDHGHTEPLPEVNDDFAKSFGGFTTVAELRAKVLENVTKERERDTKDKRRVQIMEAIINDTKFDVPDILLKSENDKMFSQIEADITRAGMTMEEYMKHTGKTREGMTEEFKPEAEKRARFQLVVNAIARAEKIVTSDEEVDAEAKLMMEQYPGADLDRARAYADMLLTNEKTLAMLEGQK